MILWTDRPFFNSYTIKAAIKNEKILIDGSQIDTGMMTYTQKSRLMYNHARSVNALTFPDLKKYYIPPGWLLYGKK